MFKKLTNVQVRVNAKTDQDEQKGWLNAIEYLQNVKELDIEVIKTVNLKLQNYLIGSRQFLTGGQRKTLTLFPEEFVLRTQDPLGIAYDPDDIIKMKAALGVTPQQQIMLDAIEKREAVPKETRENILKEIGWSQNSLYEFIRSCMYFVTDIAVPSKFILPLMKNWIQKENSNEEIAEGTAFLLLEFARIHPYNVANGRSGRLYASWLLYKTREITLFDLGYTQKQIEKSLSGDLQQRLIDNRKIIIIMSESIPDEFYSNPVTDIRKTKLYKLILDRL